jgi:hypothetical protein
MCPIEKVDHLKSRKIRGWLYSLLLLPLSVGCGGGASSSSSTTTPSQPSQLSVDLTGMWEVWGQSTVTPGTGVIIDVNMIKTGSSSFGDAAMGVYTYDSIKKTIDVGGTCGESSFNLSEGSASVSFTLTGTQNITGTGTVLVSSTNTAAGITGTYTGCNGDHGTFKAQPVQPISDYTYDTGTGYDDGILNNGDESVTAQPMAVKNNNWTSNFSTTVSIGSGPGSGESFTCSGNQYGNTISCGGTSENQRVSLLAWVDLNGLLVYNGQLVVLELGPAGSNHVSGVLVPSTFGEDPFVCEDNPPGCTPSPDPTVVYQ